MLAVAGWIGSRLAGRRARADRRVPVPRAGPGLHQRARSLARRARPGDPVARGLRDGGGAGAPLKPPMPRRRRRHPGGSQIQAIGCRLDQRRIVGGGQDRDPLAVETAKQVGDRPRSARSSAAVGSSSTSSSGSATIARAIATRSRSPTRARPVHDRRDRPGRPAPARPSIARGRRVRRVLGWPARAPRSQAPTGTGRGRESIDDPDPRGPEACQRLAFPARPPPRPSVTTRPAVGRSRPVTSRSSVVLPLPDGPVTTWKAPRRKAAVVGGRPSAPRVASP